jgi:regulation of enolase protein 1 (concanavalin A-like superfamily)
MFIRMPPRKRLRSRPENRHRHRSPRLVVEQLEDRSLLCGTGLPLLHSLPGAPNTIYLDYNGGTYGGSTYLAYDTDGDPTTCSPAEQADITEGWRQVSTYFSMFDVDVTTQKPPASAHVAWEIISKSIGNGYSYVGVYPNGQPESFVEDYFTRSRQSGMAHELGHNFGEWHQSDYNLLGNKVNEYSSGYDLLHGPIMGIDFAQYVHKWFIGHPSCCGPLPAGDLQDDIDIIASQMRRFEPPGQDGFRNDGNGHTIDTATPMAFTGAYGTIQSASGIIARLSDVDVFSFVSTGGTYHVAATPVIPSGLAVKLEIYNADGALLAANDGSTYGTSNDEQLSLTLPAGTYYAAVSSQGNYGDVGSFQVKVSTLPDPWHTRDTGYVGFAGSAEYNLGLDQYSLVGAGDDIWGTRDAFRYAYQTLTGDGSITARVLGMDNTDFYAKAGVMIRETADNPGSKNVMMELLPNGDSYLQYRASTGGGSASVYGGNVAVPYWVQLSRSTDTFNASISPDGLTWTTVGVVTIPMNATVSIGLALTSHNNTKVNNAFFDNVTFTGIVGDPPPVYNSLPAPTGLRLTYGVGTGINLSWNAVAGATDYAVERSNDNVTWAQVGTTGGATTYSDIGLLGSHRYFYRVDALDATGGSVPSDVRNLINRPSAPFNLSITSLAPDSLVPNWRDVTGDTGYRIERSDNGGFTWFPTGSVGPNVPSFTDTGLTSNTTYCYRIVARSPYGDSPNSATACGTSRLPAVTGLHFTTIAPTELDFSWNPVPGATSYRVERSTDGYNYSVLATQAGTSYSNTGLTPLRAYYYRVVGVNSQTESAPATPIFAATPATSPLPSPWNTTDVGGVGGSGAAGYNLGTFTALGSGDDIWNNADAFRYVYQVLSGNGIITARVLSVDATDGWSKAGVMLRESTLANSKNALMMVAGSNGSWFQYRSSTGGGSASAGSFGPHAPYWVRLQRIGNTFYGYNSPNGSSWTLVGSATVTMNTALWVGLAVTSHNNGLLTTATFDNVSITAGGAPGGGGGGGGGMGGGEDGDGAPSIVSALEGHNGLLPATLGTDAYFSLSASLPYGSGEGAIGYNQPPPMVAVPTDLRLLDDQESIARKAKDAHGDLDDGSDSFLGLLSQWNSW